MKADGAGRVVRLNVGGTLFETSKTTLRQGGAFFERLLSGDFNDFDESGVAFIDRDPAYFRCILQYMRSGGLELPEPLTVQGLLAEAQFFLVEGLIQRLQARIAADHAVSTRPHAQRVALQSSGCYIRIVTDDPSKTEAYRFTGVHAGHEHTART